MRRSGTGVNSARSIPLVTDGALALRHRADLNEPIRHGLTDCRGMDREAICEAVERGTPPSALIDVVDRGEHGRSGAEQMEHSRRHIRRKGVAVHEVRMKAAQKAMQRVASPDEKPSERFAHVKPDDFERGGPFMRLARLEHDENNLVPARSHAFSQRDDLAFSAAYAERG